MSDRLVELLTDAVEAGRTAATNLGKSDLWPHLDRIDSILEHVSQHELRSANFTRELELAVVSVLAQQMYLLRYDFWGVFKDKQVHWGIMEVPLQVALEKLNRFHLLTRLEADLAQKRLKTEVESITFPPFDLKTKFENLDNFLAQIAKLKSSFAAVYNSSQTFGTLQAALSTFRDRMSGKSPSLAGDDATAKLFKDLYTLRKIQSYTRLAILENKTRPFSTSVHGLPRFASNDEYKPVLPYILEAREESIAKYAAHRILQATGEYLKATDQTPHLTKDTQAQITTSHKVPVDQITKLRDHLSHCNSFVALRQRRKLEWVDKSTRQLQKSLQRVAGAIDSFCSALELQSIKMLTSEAAVYCPGLRFDASEAEWMTRSLPTFAQIRDAKESCRRKVQELRQQLRDVLQGGDETAPAPVWDLYSHLEYLEWAQHTSICCFHINPDKIPTPAVIHERLEGGERPDDYGTRIKLYHEYSFKGMLPDHTKEAEADAPDSSRWTTAELEDLFDPFVECLLGDFMTPETFSKLRGFYPSWKFEETEIPGVASEIVRRMRFVGCGQDFGHRIELFVYLSCLRAASEPKRGGLDGSVPVQYAHLLRCIGGQDPGWSSLKLPLHNTGTENGREDYTRILRTTSEKLRDGVSVEEVIQAKLSQIVERLEAEDDREKVATLINDKRREFEEKRAEIDRLKAANTGANVRRHEERLRQLDYVKLLNSEKQRTFHGRARILDKVLAPLPTDLLLACREKYREIELESLRLHLQHRVEALRAIWPKADEEVIEDLIWSDIRYCQDFVEAVAFLALDITTTLKEFGDTAGNKQLGDAPSLASKSVRARGPYTNPVLVEAALFAALPVRNFLAHGDMLVEAMIPHLNSVAILNLAAGLLRNSNAILSLLDLFLAKNQSMLKHLEAMLHAGNLTTLTPDSLPGELRTERNARLIADLQGEDWLNLVQGVLRQQQHKTSKCDLLRAELDRHKFQAHLKSLRPAEPNCGPCAEFDDLGMTTLHHAVLRGDLDGVAALLPLGNAALVNSQECKNGKKSGLSPLHIAAAKGNCEIVSKLVELGADLNSVGSNLYSPLHFAALHGKSDVVTLLLEKGAAWSFSLIGEHPIHLAVRNNHGETVDLFLLVDNSLLNMKTLQYTDSRGRVQPPKTLFELAGEYCRWELQRRLTQTALHLGLQDLGTCLVQAAECLHLEGVEECLRKGADPNSRRGHGEKNAMQWAAESERHREQGVLREITWLLLSYDADPNVPDARGRTAIYSAIIGRGCKEERKLKERLGVVRLLVEQGAKVECRDNDGQTPAHAAAERCLDVLQYFVDELQVNLSGVEDRKGNSVLHVAAPYRYVEEYKETIQFILAKYPELLDRQNNDGMTALHLCIASCSGAIGCEKNAVQLLLDAGADVFAGSEDKSLVHEVVRCRAQGYPGSRCNQLLRSVLKAMEGSPQHRCQHVNSKDRDGFTPLMKACAYEPQRSFVKLLEGNGADDTDNGASFVELLLENGARVVAEEWLSSLGWVRRCPNPEVARKVLQRMEGPLELVDNTDTVIHESILNPNPQVLREVLTFFSSEFPAEFPQWINYRSRIGNTALAWAAAHSKGSAAKVRLLLDFGADVDKPNTTEGNSPLHLAARYGEVEIIRVLVSGGAALSLPNNGGKLPCDLWTYFLSDLPPSAPNEDCRAEVTRILTHVVSDTN